MKTIIKETQQLKEIYQNLSRQSVTAYRDFLDSLRNSKPLLFERKIPSTRDGWYQCQLSTGELVAYCAKQNKNWKGELEETITIEYLLPHETIENNYCGRNTIIKNVQEVAKNANSIIDNAQRMIFVVQFIVALSLAGFMLWPQLNQSQPVEPLQRNLPTQIGKP